MMTLPGDSDIRYHFIADTSIGLLISTNKNPSIDNINEGLFLLNTSSGQLTQLFNDVYPYEFAILKKNNQIVIAKNRHDTSTFAPNMYIFTDAKSTQSIVKYTQVIKHSLIDQPFYLTSDLNGSIISRTAESSLNMVMLPSWIDSYEGMKFTICKDPGNTSVTKVSILIDSSDPTKHTYIGDGNIDTGVSNYIQSETWASITLVLIKKTSNTCYWIVESSLGTWTNITTSTSNRNQMCHIVTATDVTNKYFDLDSAVTPNEKTVQAFIKGGSIQANQWVTPAGVTADFTCWINSKKFIIRNGTFPVEGISVGNLSELIVEGDILIISW
jgi:hypothetical protein